MPSVVLSLRGRTHSDGDWVYFSVIDAVDRMRAGIQYGTDALNKGDLDEVLPLYEPDFELHMIGWGGMVSELYIGHDRFRAIHNEWTETLENVQWTVEEVRPLEQGALVRYRFEGRGRQT